MFEAVASRVMLSWGARRVFLSLFAGAFGALALAPVNLFATMFVSFTLLVWLLDGAAAAPGAGLLAKIWPTFLTGWLFGFGYFTAGMWWLGNALLEDGGTYAWAIPLAAAGIPAVLAIFFGVATALARTMWSDGLGRIAALALAFAITEWLRSFLFTGLPWNVVGIAAMPVPLLMQPVHLIGLNGMNLLAVLVFSMPALLGTGRGGRVGIALALALILTNLGYGYWVLDNAVPSNPDERPVVRLVQPDQPLSPAASDVERSEIFEDLLALSSAPPQKGGRKPDIIVWPETSIPFILSENEAAFTRIAEVLDEGQILVAGAVRAEDGGAGSARRYYNSIYVFNSLGQIVSASDKVHLVPFGEYLPFEEELKSAGLTTIAAMSHGYSAAAVRSELELPTGLKFYPLVCYEAIFASEIDDRALDADALINVTIDTWFGRTPGPFQHFQHARITAVELGIPLIRSANSGISAVINQYGEIIAASNIATKGIIDTTLTIKSVSTLNNHQRLINFWLLCAMILFFIIYSRVSFISDRN